MSLTYDILSSWKNRKGSVNSMEDILGWVKEKNESLKVEIVKVPFSYDGFWHYDESDGFIRNGNNSFFQIAGYQEMEGDTVVCEQPILLQKEVGYLGILCKKINGELNFLMQAKVEPGNVNVIQISPTIQATKSNFTRKHGGNAPAYLEYFSNSGNYTIVLDQLQSEQASRFLGKRNRNIMICLDEDTDVEVLPSHKWMTLGQIKECMKIKNLVNMDTRTVLSCIPFSKTLLDEGEFEAAESLFKDKAFCNSMFKNVDYDNLHLIYNKINDHKMYRDESSRLVPLRALKSWELTENEIVCKYPYDFKAVYCRIEIEGREVRFWEQPLFEANGIAVFGIFTTVEDGIRKFLVRIKHEIGSFDGVELGPVVQMEPSNPRNNCNELESMFFNYLNEGKNVIFDNILSEEGGRFYHEENRNVIIELASKEEAGDLPEDYYWVDFATLNYMIQFNNCINIQLRNLLSVLDMF